jgi:hypothetical protein
MAARARAGAESARRRPGGPKSLLALLQSSLSELGNRRRMLDRPRTAGNGPISSLYGGGLGLANSRDSKQQLTSVEVPLSKGNTRGVVAASLSTGVEGKSKA